MRWTLLAFAAAVVTTPASVRALCTESGVPNGTVDEDNGEECDDDNMTSSDGCENDCTITPTYACAPPIVFDTIEVQNAPGGAREASWTIDSGGLSAIQTVNTTEPTVGRLPGADAFEATYTFDIAVETNGDDDFIGFVVGYDDGEVTSPTADYLLIDWKQFNQNICGGVSPAGLAVSRVTGASTTANGCDFWLHQGIVNEFARSPLVPPGLGAAGWSEPPAVHRFVIRYSPTTLRMTVDGVEQLNIAPPAGETFPPGEIGLYGFSQQDVRYTIITPTAPSICNRPPVGEDEEIWVVTGTPEVVAMAPRGYSDPDGDPADPGSLRVTMAPAGTTTTDPGSGEMDGVIRMNPADDMAPGTYVVEYEHCDDHPVIPLCTTNTITIHYNDPPTPMDRTETVFEGGTTSVPIDDIVADTDAGTVQPPGGVGGVDPGSVAVSGSSTGPFSGSAMTALGGTCEIVGGSVVYTAPTGDAALGLTDTCYVEVCETEPDSDPRACGVASFDFEIPRCACVIDDVCIDEGTRNPANGCQLCVRAASSTSYTMIPGCTPCTDDSMCGDPTPACDVSVGVCVPCTADRYCPDAAPVCDTEAQTCGPCTADDECAAIDPAAPVCLPTGECGECATSATCPADEPVCNPTSNTCEPCSTDLECATIDADLPICAPDGTCVECTDGAMHCPADTPICDAESNTCAPCVSDEECMATDPTVPVCASGECVECTRNEHCSGTLICDLSTNTCQPCRTDAECTDPEAPLCDVESGRCEECTADEHCDGELVCTDASPRTCVECDSDFDCPFPLTCGEDNTCGPECRSDDDCVAIDPAEPVCDTGTCVECLLDRHCDGSDVCDVDARVCVPGPCATDDDCEGDLPSCDVDEGICVECNEDADCDTGACDVDAHVCVSPCTSDDECGAPTPACDLVDGVCVECLADLHCPDGVCDVEAERCVECTLDLHCEDGVCGPDGTCVECFDDAHCPEVCDVSSGRCVECVLDEMCDDAMSCDPVVGACTGGCLSDDDCSQPLPVCDEADGECYECLLDEDCDDGELCYPDRRCRPPCSDDIECPGDLVCSDDGSCVECRDASHCPDGEVCSAEGICEPPCETDAECIDPALPVCSEQMCVECTADNVDACGADEPVCEPTSNTCVTCTDTMVGACAMSMDGAACVVEDAGARCGCLSDDDCVAGTMCDTETSVCVPRPDDHGAYSGGALCSAGTSSNTWLWLLLAVFLPNIARRRRA